MFFVNTIKYIYNNTSLVEIASSERILRTDKYKSVKHSSINARHCIYIRSNSTHGLNV